MRTYHQITLACIAAVSLALAGCSGQAGQKGTTGATGGQGSQGTPGAAASPGSITGTVMFSINGVVSPQNLASAVTVTESPNVNVTATTAPDGTYTLANLPAGYYTLTFTGPGSDYAKAVTATASVVSGAGATTVNVTLVKNDPLVLTITPSVDPNNPVANSTVIPATNPVNPVGFGLPVDLAVSANYSDGTTVNNSTITYAWSVTAGPSMPQGVTFNPLSAASGTSVVFSTPTIANLIAGGSVPNFAPESGSTTNVTQNGVVVALQPVYRPSFIGITTEMLAKMTYTVQVVATDSATKWTTTKTINVVPGTLAQANVNVPVGTTVLGYDSQTVWSWALTFQAPGATTAVPSLLLQGATTQYPWFVPDQAGIYTLTNTYATGKTTTLVVHAANLYTGAYADGKTETTGATYNSSPCMDCHSAGYGKQAYDWAYGYHGDYTSGTDQPKAAPWSATAVPPGGYNLTTPTTLLSPNATIFEAGITGQILEGGTAFYSASCMGCHTTGYNAASTAVNGGMDDIALADGWTFPVGANGQPSLTAANWTNMQPNMQHLQGIQCESCHGANTMEGWNVAAPGGFGTPAAAAVAYQTFLFPSYSAVMCGQCHDEPTFHDKFAMWAKGAHAVTEPLNFGAADSRLSALAVTTSNLYPNYGAGNCGRCHTAQGFVAFVNYMAANPSACNFSAGSGIIPNTCYLQNTPCNLAAACYVGGVSTPPTASTAGCTLPTSTSTTPSTCFDYEYGTYTYSSTASSWSLTPNFDLATYLVGLGMVSQPFATVTQTTNKEPSGAAIAAVASTQMTAVQPQTCQACHDPHTTLPRVMGASPMLQVGFSVTGAGSGALCIMCHNNRAGPRNDAVTQFPLAVVNGSNQQSVSTAHDGPQGDVFWGQNAFFMNGAVMPSKHAAVADTCVGCHVALADSSGSTSNMPNHTFRVDSALCASCHGSDVDGAGVIGTYISGVNALGTTIAQTFTNFLAANPNGLVIKGSSSNQVIVASNIASVTSATAAQPIVNTAPLYVSNNLVNVSNASAIVVNLTTAITNPNGTGTIQSYTVSVTSPLYLNTGTVAAPVVGAQALSASGLFARAFWNISLIANDHSNSVHNPSFVSAVIANTENALLKNPQALPY